jgi:hypothetical protein
MLNLLGFITETPFLDAQPLSIKNNNKNVNAKLFYAVFKDTPTLSTHKRFTRRTSKTYLLALPLNFSGSGHGIEGLLILVPQSAPARRLSDLCSFGGALWPSRS